MCMEVHHLEVSFSFSHVFDEFFHRLESTSVSFTSTFIPSSSVLFFLSFCFQSVGFLSSTSSAAPGPADLWSDKPKPQAENPCF